MRPAVSNEMTLSELRKWRGLTQAKVAKRMKSQQPYISKLERDQDPLLSTLRRYIKALGGDLEIYIKKDKDRIRITDAIFEGSALQNRS
jgi:transcriptional regulator with XRE-family HTH domain